MKYTKISLIDYENISTESMVKILKNIKDDEKVIVVMGSTSPSRLMFSLDEALSLKRENIEVKVTDRQDGTLNAVDFVLVTVLGSIISSNEAESYRIISHDRGFLPVIRYWREQGIIIDSPTLEYKSNKDEDFTFEDERYTDENSVDEYGIIDESYTDEDESYTDEDEEDVYIENEYIRNSIEKIKDIERKQDKIEESIKNLEKLVNNNRKHVSDFLNGNVEL